MTCRKCGRELHPWPLPHPGCAPAEWVRCISTDPKRATPATPGAVLMQPRIRW